MLEEIGMIAEAFSRDENDLLHQHTAIAMDEVLDLHYALRVLRNEFRDWG